MKKDIYVYPAILSYDNDGISVEFPDLPGCLTCGDTTEEALKMAKEALGLHLYGMEEDNDIIPNATTIDKLNLEKNQIPTLIEIYMPIHRKAIENYSVKKTLTIPQWLNREAEKHKVNFSQILQEALKNHLNIH
ncbi:TPA: type II toxin-antitoxin system HicB family antitoxin [Clostridioides difficile]|uniref:type II toxin-antitoxin system HicB family antitoxin n=1 Tax=Clostridioides difficile TaxID=1496 RepID=UPI00097FEC53|nr:type II toxin-antitoxin system HicB family antitoxin [Clostridioides difficile]AXU28783.1 phage-like protein [Clostridioides difficile]AXU32571.1 phage-like protein [Clostridioides difficile]AXU36359.1 phage-like protein [Clostridioides difficile]MCP8413164.1 type II toxin-antitoxin system HicB family antitoxin [Clostridioides difficile]MDC9392143.1 type II toxin-antitoxin system HicB family antitoxin [Clostridioides difficile]